LFANKFLIRDRFSGIIETIEKFGSTKTFITGYKISNPNTSRKIPNIKRNEKFINFFFSELDKIRFKYFE
tara:strand:- start:206 stop:415 length:210 start_codon:yes stop_codon:yes gene_type:complete